MAEAPPVSFDRTYLGLRAQQSGCDPSDMDACCRKAHDRFDQAMSHENVPAATEALDLLANACPDANAVDLLPRVATMRPKLPADPLKSGIIAVKYVADLGRTDGLYWIGAFVDGVAHPRAFHTVGAHRLDIEVHVMTAKPEGGADQLFVLKTSKQVLVQPGGTDVTVVVKRVEDQGGKTPFTLSVPDIWPEPVPGAPPPVPPLAMTDARRLRIVQAKRTDRTAQRRPSELGGKGNVSESALVCFNRNGAVVTVSPLASPHPRYTAALVDDLFHARFDPATLDGEPISSCQPHSYTFEYR